MQFMLEILYVMLLSWNYVCFLNFFGNGFFPNFPKWKALYLKIIYKTTRKAIRLNTRIRMQIGTESTSGELLAQASI